MPGQTPWQTVGPFFHFALPWEGCADLVPSVAGETASAQDGARGPAITITGRVVDGAGEPVPDALVEIWQADSAGRYPSSDDVWAPEEGFVGFGRSPTGAGGEFSFRTYRPGPVPGPGNSWQAPHVAVSVFARGMLRRLVTRIYFGDAPENAEDPVLASVPAERRDTLIAVQRAETGVFHFEIILQGENETVFFDC